MNNSQFFWTVMYAVPDIPGICMQLYSFMQNLWGEKSYYDTCFDEITGY